MELDLRFRFPERSATLNLPAVAQSHCDVACSYLERVPCADVLCVHPFFPGKYVVKGPALGVVDDVRFPAAFNHAARAEPASSRRRCVMWRCRLRTAPCVWCHRPRRTCLRRWILTWFAPTSCQTRFAVVVPCVLTAGFAFRHARSGRASLIRIRVPTIRARKCEPSRLFGRFVFAG